jgi:hypothetical protein
MTLDRKRQIGFVHAASVVNYANESAAAILYRDVNAPRAGVEGVLDELLDGGTGALDYLAGGDAIDQNGIKTADGHGRILSRPIIYAQRRSAASIKS